MPVKNSLKTPRLMLLGIAMLAMLSVGCFYAWFDITEHIEQVGDFETDLSGDVFTVSAEYELVDHPDIPANFPGFGKIGFWITVLEGDGCPCTIKNSWPPNGGVGSVIYADLDPGEIVTPGDTFEVTAEIELDSIAPFTIFATPCGAVHVKGDVEGDCPVHGQE